MRSEKEIKKEIKIVKKELNSNLNEFFSKLKEKEFDSELWMEILSNRISLNVFEYVLEGSSEKKGLLSKLKKLKFKPPKAEISEDEEVSFF